MIKASLKVVQNEREITRLSAMLHVRFSRCLRKVEDLLHKRGIDISHESVRYWWNRFGPMFAVEIRKKSGQSNAVVFELAVVLGLGFREDQW
jgi:putative transposase